MRQRLFAALCSLVLLATAPIFALEPYLVKDINPVAVNPSSNPRSFFSLNNGIALFLADTEFGDTELWRSDGTAGGTYKLTDTCATFFCTSPIIGVALAGDRLFYLAATWPGTLARELWVTGGSTGDTFDLGVSLRVPAYAPSVWVQSRGLLFFGASDDTHGEVLWRSDGTPAGTYRLTEFTPFDLAELRGKLYFRGPGRQGQAALWTSDGTPQGTKLVKDVPPSALLSTGSALVFFGPGPGVTLWRSDGTAKGTTQIATIVRKPADLILWEVVALAGRYYFTTEIKGQGEELWASDGTKAGTRRLTNFANAKAFHYDEEDGYPEPLYLPLQAAGSRLVFAADDGVHGGEPWVTDGTPAGTRLLRDLCPGSCWSGRLDRTTTFGSRLIFEASTPTQGSELWATDGTPVGTRLLRDICPGTCPSIAYGMVRLGAGLIFAATEGENVFQLWKTDGTPRGTARITNVPREVASFFRIGAAVPGAVLLSAATRTEGVELWRTDGTAAGTRLLRDIGDQDQGGSNPFLLIGTSDRLYFQADDGLHGNQLWTSQGTEESTALVYDFGQDGPGTPVAAGNSLFVLRSVNEELELWRMSPTGSGAALVSPSGLRVPSPNQPFLMSAGNRVFFTAQVAESRELWTSDGTPGGTHRLDLPPGTVNAVTSFQGRLVFNVGVDIWASDGDHTAPLYSYSSNYSSRRPEFLGEHGGRLWFEAHTPGTNNSDAMTLWSTDGTPQGTTAHTDFPIGSERDEIFYLASAGSRMFLTASGLWVSDGTAAGTRRISSSYFERAVSLGSKLFYWYQNILWSSDGTEAGTGPVLDAAHERIGKSPWGDLAASGGHVYFVRNNELWRTDGSPAGTVKVGGRMPQYLTPALGRLFFSAWDPATGHELWAVGPQ